METKYDLFTKGRILCFRFPSIPSHRFSPTREIYTKIDIWHLANLAVFNCSRIEVLKIALLYALVILCQFLSCEKI